MSVNTVRDFRTAIRTNNQYTKINPDVQAWTEYARPINNKIIQKYKKNWIKR